MDLVSPKYMLLWFKVIGKTRHVSPRFYFFTLLKKVRKPKIFSDVFRDYRNEALG